MLHKFSNCFATTSRRLLYLQEGMFTDSLNCIKNISLSFLDDHPRLKKALVCAADVSSVCTKKIVKDSSLVSRIILEGVVFPQATRFSKRFGRYINSELENFRNLANAMPQIVWTADANGNVDFFNKPYFEYTGIDPLQMTESCWEKAMCAEDLAETRARWQHSIQSHEPFAMEQRVRRASDGMVRWHMSRAVPVFDRSGKVLKWYGTSIDIHDYKILTDKLKKTQKAAVLASASKSTFLANMSHEIRTPLGAILGFVELLGQPDLSREEINRFISVISRNSKQLLRLVDDILDLTKVEAGKVVIEYVEFSLVQLLSDVCCLMEVKARDKFLDFKIDVLSPLPTVVRCDPYRLRQILSNALSNAMKFTDKGGVHLSVALSATHFEFSIRDTGCGISPEQSKNLFRPFSQATTSTTREYGGTGLGLALTKKLAEAMGGDYWLEHSELGKGSTFCARIPVEIPSESVLVDKKDLSFVCENALQKVPETQSLLGKRVLLVEDMPDNQKLISLYLQKLGCEITLAVNGKDGFDKAHDDVFDVVLMDIQMPLMDGYEATRLLRQNNFRKPIIALTAHAMAEERKKALDSGFDGFLSKPVQRQQLIDVLESYLH